MARRERSFFFDNKTGKLESKGKVITDATNTDNVAQLKGSTSGNPVQLVSVGDDTNIDLRLSAKGDGNIELLSTVEITTGKRIIDSAGTNVEFGDDIHMNSNKVTNLGTPSASTDAATKGYVDTYYLPLTGGTISSNLTISGDLTVSGTTTTVNSETISLADNIIDLNSNFTSGSPTENAGIRVIRGDSNATLIRWNETSDKWELTNDGSTYGNIAVTGDITLSTLSVTATASELNILDGVTATATELNYVSGVTSAIQTQIDNISSSFTLSDNQGTPNTDTFTTGQTLTFAGSTGIDTTVSDNQVAIAIDSTVATLTGSQTLTNKTIALGSNTLSGTTAQFNSALSDGSFVTLAGTETLTNKTITSPTVSGLTLSDASIVIEGATADDFETTLTITDPTADRTITLQNASGTVAFLTDNVASATALETARTIAGQSFDGTADITIASTDLSNSSSITLNTATQTLTNKTLTAPVISSITNTGTLTLPTTTGTVALTSDISLSTLSVTATAAELNILDGVTATTAELNYTDGVTSNIQTQLDAKAPTAGPTFTGTLTYATLNDGTTALTSTVAELNVLDGITATTAELNYTDGVTSNIQTQLDARLPLAGGTMTGTIAAFESTGIDDNASSTAVTIDSSGNLGIGTSSPASKTHIIGASNDTVSQANANLNIEGAGGNGIVVGTISSSPYTSYLQSGFVDNFATATYPISLNPEGGNVGIGTTSPNQKLTVGGSASGTVALQVTNSTAGTAFNDGIQMFINDTAGGLNMREAYPLQFYVNGSERMRIDSSGNVGIGTSPSNKLDVSGDIGLLARGEVRFYDTDSSNYVALRASGTVTSNLTFSLPTAYGDNGQALTSDGAGGTSWTTVSGGGGSSGFTASTTTTVPGSSSNYDLAEGPAQDGDETPFEAGAVDAFGVNLGTIYDCMEPTGSLNTVDYGDSEAYVGA